MKNNIEWHALSEDEVFRVLHSTKQGLSSSEAKARLKRYGKNELKEVKKIKPLMIFLSQFNSFFIYLLFIAVIISGLIGHWVDCYAIIAIIIFNGIIGFAENYRAEKAIENLKKILVPRAKVIRNSILQEINATEVVPGDILVINEGDKIVADCRVFECHDLQCNEAVLTGESMPVDKQTKVLPIETELNERTNMLYSGTTAVRGSCKAVVTATGMATEFGKIASLVQEVKTPRTPLQIKMDNFAKKIGIITIVLCAVVAGIGIALGIEKIKMFLTAVSLAVAAVPEGLPAVITICLAIAVHRMYKIKSLIRRLAAAETLGRVTTICTDKTGTLTAEEMTVVELFYDNKTTQLKKIKLKSSKALALLLKTNCLCNNARVEKVNGNVVFIGDPTEKALLKAAFEAGLDKKVLTEKEPRIKEFAFSSKRKRMTIVRKVGKKAVSYVKGAPEIILDLCTKELINNKVVQLTQKRKQELKSVYEKMAQKGLRVLGFAFKELEIKKKIKQQEAESKLIFVGFQALLDPPRPEVKSAVKNCKDAGISIKIITGDSPLTTATIAKMIGIEGKTLTGAEIDKLNDDELARKLKETAIFARTTPEHKLRIVNLLKKQQEVVAVTGDGINDAPALKRADIGIAMGIRGTDVARDVSDLVLTDDNFANIPKAVKEGRQVFDNIKKFSYYLISSNLAEIAIILFVLLFGIKLGLPTLLALLPVQLLWVNLVTDGFIAITLSFEHAEADVMKRKPERGELFSLKVLAAWLALAAIITTGTIFLFNILTPQTASKAQTIAFSSLVLFEGFNALNFRSFKQPLYKLKVNLLLLLAIGASFLLQAAAVHLPALQPVFGTNALTKKEWLAIGLISISIIIVGEGFKIVRMKKR